MAEIVLADILKRATENCARDGFRWEASEPTLLSRFIGHRDPKTKVLDQFGRLTYLAEAHWELFAEALRSKASRVGS